MNKEDNLLENAVDEQQRIDNNSGFNVKLSSFSGPLDLLCHLVDSSELDITEINLTELISQYVEFLLVTEKTPLNELVEFFSFASRLILRKVNSLFPTTANDEIADEPEDEYDEEDLLRTLENFIPYRNAAQFLADCQAERERYFTRSCDEDIRPFYDLGDLYGLSSRWWELLDEYRRNKENETDYEEDLWDDIPDAVPEEQIVDQRMEELTALVLKMPVSLSSLLSERNKKNLIVTLLALLEMSRLGIVKIIQNSTLGEIEIVSK